MDLNKADSNPDLSQLDLKDRTPVELAGHNHLIVKRILRHLPSKQLLTLRSLNRAWNDNVLQTLSKRDNLTIDLSAPRLINNTIDCFRDEESKFLLRHVTVKLNEHDDNRLVLFLNQHQEHVVHLRVINANAQHLSTDDYFPIIWDSLDFPQLESLETVNLKLTYIPDLHNIPFEKKASVKKLRLVHDGRKSMELTNLLMAATPCLQELTILTDKIPDLSLLSTKTLKEFNIETLQSPLRDQSEEEALENLNKFLYIHGEGLKSLILTFRSNVVMGEILFPSPMPKLKVLSLIAPAILNLSPVLVPNLDFLATSLWKLHEHTLNSLKEGFVNLTYLLVEITVNENTKFEKLLSLCENANHVNVMPFGRSSSSEVLKILVPSLKRYRNLKKLEIWIVFEVNDNVGTEPNTNIHEFDDPLKGICGLALNGLEDLTVRVYCKGNWDKSNPCVYGDWEKKFASMLLNLSTVMKRMRIEIMHSSSVFSPELENFMMQNIDEKSLPLKIQWTTKLKSRKERLKIV